MQNGTKPSIALRRNRRRLDAPDDSNTTTLQISHTKKNTGLTVFYIDDASSYEFAPHSSPQTRQIGTVAA
ncbi:MULTISPECIES: hypothetical protein [Burkholderia]|uniref:hypothetical protein n=1 Tax=Burkholderia TaxID=32008 RepID=UPI000B1AA193|nr:MULTISPECIES: hypothetical protein [Burkholderia]